MEIDADRPGKDVHATTAPPDICVSSVRDTLHEQGIEASETECTGIAKFLIRVAPPSAPVRSLPVPSSVGSDRFESAPSPADVGQIACLRPAVRAAANPAPIQTPAGLPYSIEGLRDALLRGKITVADALTRQQQALREDRWHCVARMGEQPASVSDVTLPLAGIGLAHKDIFVVGQRLPDCGAGGPPAGWTSSGGALVLERLAAQGAASLAALNMAPYACGATAENDAAPTMINPVDADAAVGGSSSGSGVAVAAGLCYAALGTDTAGSVRMPAATCGVIGLKTSARLLPERGVVPLAPTLDTVGVLARTSADAMAVLAAALTTDDARILHENHKAVAQRELRMTACFDHADPGIGLRGDVAQALHTLATDLCARKQPLVPEMRELQRLADIVLYTEAARVHGAALRAQQALPRSVRHLALTGSAIPPAWYDAARQQQAAHQQAFLLEALGDCDMLLTPALPAGVPDARHVTTTSPDFQPRQLLAMFSWMSFVNYLGLPAVVVPIATDERGRPICVQAIARPGQEGTLLAFASIVEQRRPDAFSSMTSFKQNNETCLN